MAADSRIAGTVSCPPSFGQRCQLCFQAGALRDLLPHSAHAADLRSVGLPWDTRLQDPAGVRLAMVAYREASLRERRCREHLGWVGFPLWGCLDWHSYPLFMSQPQRFLTSLVALNQTGVLHSCSVSVLACQTREPILWKPERPGG